MEKVEKYELTTRYELYREWISEIDFYQNEIDFLEELLSQYYITIKQPEYYIKFENIAKDITQIKSLLINLKSSIYTQNKLLSIVIENNNRGEETFEKNHLFLTSDFKNLIKTVKEIKSSVYDVMIDVLKINKQKRIVQ